MASYVLLKTTAEDHPSLPVILWEAVRDVLGIPARPWYVVFENLNSSPVKEYRADVHVNPCPLGTKQPYMIHGRSMPTIKQSIQVAAWECLARLHFSERVLSGNRAFHFLPAKDPESPILAKSPPGEKPTQP